MSRSEPTEAEWLRRAIRHCEHWGCASATLSSLRAWECRPGRLARPRHRDGGVWAGWLPAEVRTLRVEELRARLAAIEGEPAQE